MQLITGHFEADGAIIYLPIGFVPDYFFMCDLSYTTATIFYHWWRQMESDAFATALEGVSVSQGVTADLATTAGISAYDTGTQAPTILDYNSTNADAATARSATANGTFLRPSATGTTVDGLVADRSMVFECVTAGDSSAEPSWPVGIGDQVTDGTNVYELVVEPTFRKGYAGVAIAAALMTDGDEHFYNAWQADQAIDQGDVASWDGGIYGS